jgi:hypothetical protein
LNSAAAAVGAWIYFSVAMAGFNTSQQTLSAQMIDLSSALRDETSIREKQNNDAQLNLSDEVQKLSLALSTMQEKLSSSLAENSKQIAALNGTLVGIDKRLTESIERQEAFQAVVLQRIVFQGLIQSENFGIIVDAWQKAGIDPAAIKSITVNGDEGFAEAVKQLMLKDQK